MMQPFAILLAEKHRFHLERFFIGHSLLLGEEKRKDLVKRPSFSCCKQTMFIKLE